jgi:hypothetical protein
MLMRQRLLLVTCVAVLVAFGWALFGPAWHAQAAPTDGFVAPLPTPLTVLHEFDPPAQPWLPGNRGVDLAATTGEPVVAAAGGVVLYAGPLAGRGVVSIDHGATRTTYEPVDAVVTRGQTVRRGQVIGRVAAVSDGCGPLGGCLHWGAIRADGYVDPLGLLAVAHVRLLPIWVDGLPLPPVPAPVDRTATNAQATTTAAPVVGPAGVGGTGVGTGLGIVAGSGIVAGLGIVAVSGIGAAGLWRARRARLADARASSARKLPAL